MTSIAVKAGPTIVGENRAWLQSQHGADAGANPSVTLDVAAFTKATHYPDGFVPSGTVLGKIAGTGRYGPYDNAATDGRGVAAGFLYGSLVVDGLAKVGGALVVHGFVDAARLPANSGLDANARTDLSHVIFAN